MGGLRVQLMALPVDGCEVAGGKTVLPNEKC